ncbi:dolichol kinase [Hyperthermus butylicus]|uniref:Dolichol kinase [Lipid metabolism], SEC59 n=1 Tax=Hyperthermus butylicus (strain DSM 5456 / JCM 9403 / PLM1-5) TaxID=415426 RepID=A2BKN5_HYPBU|nr:dolichol kinase [Hyperthermus butylicus]ABM80546.1 Dolichol kinase [Lipid metabolism], SEC59 [Hyperthermus butylicus DSM 5456]
MSVLDAYAVEPGLLISDLLRSLPLAAWVLFVVYGLARWSYEWAKARWGESVGVYFARKVIHMAAGGVVALLLPFVFREPWIPFLLGLALAAYVYMPHRTGKLMEWFQDPSNISEVYYCLSWGLAVLVAWPLNVWLAVFPLFLMSFGDGVTGIIRGIRQRRRVKSWDGTIGFMAVSIPVGAAIFGVVGALTAIIAALVEKQGLIDDNISVPLVSLAILLAAHAAGILPAAPVTV